MHKGPEEKKYTEVTHMRLLQEIQENTVIIILSWPGVYESEVKSITGKEGRYEREKGGGVIF